MEVRIQDIIQAYGTKDETSPNIAAYEWRDNTEVLSNLKPSVLFGNRYSEYRAYLSYFKDQYQIIQDLKKPDIPTIPMDGPWNGK